MQQHRGSARHRYRQPPPKPHIPSASARFIAIASSLTGTYTQVLDDAFAPVGRWDRFLEAPASRNGHHSGRGGLLAHTVEVAETCLVFCAKHSDVVHREVLITAALLHDLGKVDEYQFTPAGVQMSDTGRLVGHKTTTAIMVGQALTTLKQVSPCHALAILNCISAVEHSSAHYRGHASLEAVLLSRADQVSAAADLFRLSLARGRGKRFVGYSHPHLREHPVHPCAETGGSKA